MAKLTRKEVIDRVKAGKSLAKEDLSGLDLRGLDLTGVNLSRADLSEANLSGAYLSGAYISSVDLSGAYLICAALVEADLSEANLSRADLSEANLSRANLSRATLSHAKISEADLHDARLSNAILYATDLWGANLNGANLSKSELSDTNLHSANLRGANLRECNLESANLGGADLSGADLTGANIWNIATADWKIDGVKCKYAFNSKYGFDISFEEESKRTRRNFAPGEFEQIYKSFPRLELIFKEGFSNLDHQALLAVVNHIKQELSDLEIRKFERVGDTTTVTLTAKTNETLEKIADEKLPKIYAEMLRGFTEIKNHLVHQNPQLPASIPKQWLAQLKETFKQIIHPPDEVRYEGKPVNFKEKFGKWVAKKGLKIPEETFYRFLAELGIIFFRGFLPPH